MAEITRYNEGSSFGGGRRTATAVHKIRRAQRRNLIKTTSRTLNDGERLDTIAHQVYGDGRLWWILAAASDIGYAMQVPAGTLIKVPVLSDVLRVIG